MGKKTVIGIVVVIFIVVITVAVYFSVVSSKKKTTPLPARSLHKVLTVIDGDTIVVDIDGREETVRLIGVDSPEIVDSSKPVQCFAKESSDFATNILTGKNIYLEPDSTQADRDKFNRLLRYVFLEDDTNFNLLLIKEGCGREYTYKGQIYKYRDEFTAAEKEAKSNLLGLWSCGIAVN